MALLRRCGGKCWWCGKDLEGRAARHHRQRRRDGGDRLSNLVLLHPECHNIYPKSVHQNPTEAIDYGFIVPSWAEPDAFAIFVKNNYWLLDDDGNMKGPVESPT